MYSNQGIPKLSSLKKNSAPLRNHQEQLEREVRTSQETPDLSQNSKPLNPLNTPQRLESI